MKSNGGNEENRVQGCLLRCFFVFIMYSIVVVIFKKFTISFSLREWIIYQEFINTKV